MLWHKGPREVGIISTQSFPETETGARGLVFVRTYETARVLVGHVTHQFVHDGRTRRCRRMIDRASVRAAAPPRDERTLSSRLDLFVHPEREREACSDCYSVLPRTSRTPSRQRRGTRLTNSLRGSTASPKCTRSPSARSPRLPLPRPVTTPRERSSSSVAVAIREMQPSRLTITRPLTTTTGTPSRGSKARSTLRSRRAPTAKACMPKVDSNPSRDTNAAESR